MKQEAQPAFIVQKYKRVKVVNNKEEERQHASLIKSYLFLSCGTKKAHLKKHFHLYGFKRKHFGG